MPINKPEVWSDIHQSIAVDGQGSIKKSINVDAVKTSIDNILCTRKGERVMLPEFASDVSSMVFEPISESLMQFLAREVKNTIETWDDRVEVLGVDYNSDPDQNKVDIQVQFRIKGYLEVLSHTVQYIR